jgi:homocitrate synthase NifV
MEFKVAVIDQTVNEALRRDIRAKGIELMAPLLQKYSLEAVDVSLPYWAKSDIGLNRTALLHFLRCKIGATNKEIAQAREIGFSKVIIAWRHRPGIPSLSRLVSALTEAGDFDGEVYLSIENASDFSAAEMKCYWPLLVRHNVKRFIYRDQDSVLDPFRVCRDLNILQQTAPCPIEFHGHNAYGLATANSLAALRAGIGYVGTAVGGIGLPGHAAMEEVLMAVRHLWKQEQIPAGYSLAADCERILAPMGISLPVDKAIIGRGVFAHESGIHVDGIAKNPLLYEVIQPEEVGLTRQLIVGKHSGTASLKAKFRQWDLVLNRLEAVEMLEKVKDIAEAQKSPLSDGQLWQLYMEHGDKEQGLAWQPPL